MHLALLVLIRGRSLPDLKINNFEKIPAGGAACARHKKTVAEATVQSTKQNLWEIQLLRLPPWPEPGSRQKTHCPFLAGLNHSMSETG
jgi:hypothetical protein